MTYATTTELKNTLTSVLQSYNFSQPLIDQLLSDEFINGAFSLIQNEPENDEFMSFVRSFSDEQNLYSIVDAQNKITEELSQEGYFASIFQYVIDAWRDIDFSSGVQLMSAQNEEENNSITQKDIDKANTITDIVMGILNLPIAATNIIDEAFLWSKIAIAVHEQDKKIWEILEGRIAEEERLIRGLQENFSTAKTTRSPLIVDLDGDGVETTTVENGAYFDHDNNGFAEKTGWVGKDDGLLARDLNGNGQIDDGTELFGNNSVLSNGQKASNGFEALADLDSNNDGVFNNSDASWAQVKVWKDTNQNGKADEGELLTLEQAGIESIDLDYQNSNITDANENKHSQTGTFTKTDGATGSVHDVWFNADYADTIDETNIEIPADIAALPNIEGFGNVHDLHTAMALDISGELKALIQQYAAETNAENRQTILYNIIYHWTGVQDEPIDGRDPTQIYGKVIDDTRKLEALEEFMGEDYAGTWCWGERDPNPHGKAAPYILQAFDILAEYVNNELLAQTHYKPLLENVKLIWDDTTETWNADVSGAVTQIKSIYNENAENGILTLKEFERLLKNCGYNDLQSIYEAFRTYGSLTGNDLDTMFAKFGYTYGTDLNDDLTGTSGVDEINGLAGNDSIYGGAGNDSLDGGAGNDNIFGEDGNDILIGGEGNDYLLGGNGADTYIFNPGFGNDAIDNSDDNASANEPDIIQFGEGILASKTTLERQGYDLIIKVSYEDASQPVDTLRVYSYFNEMGQSSETINAITFTDGTSWNYEYVSTHWNRITNDDGGGVYEGTNNNDNLYGSNGHDILIGNNGNDYLDGNSGNDLVIGGKGNDRLIGRDGSDTYIYNLGDGLDTIDDIATPEYCDIIKFGEGINFNDLTFRSEGKNLRIIINGDETQGLILSSYFHASVDTYRNKILKFANGSYIDLNQIGLTLHQTVKTEIESTAFDDVVYMADVEGNNIRARAGNDTIYGSALADTIDGEAGDDTLYGNGGNDSINGREGNDLIIGNSGDDKLYGGDGSDTYIYNLGDGLDTIDDTTPDGTNDIIKFGEGINFNNLTFRSEGKNLRIIINGDETQGLILSSYFHTWVDTYRNKIFEFADGSSVALNQIGLTLHQTVKTEINCTAFDDVVYMADVEGNNIRTRAGNDTIYGSALADTMDGEAGDDTLYGNGGNDTLSGGDGADILYGNDGNDILKGLSGDDVMYGGTGDDNIYGGDGSNYYSNEGNDTLIGGIGNDNLYGGYGNDTYIYNLGDGFDTISETNGSDKIVFGEGITQNDLSFEQNGNNLKIFIGNDENNVIQINNQFGKAALRVETIEFSDGNTLDISNADQLIQAINTFGVGTSSTMDVLSNPTQDVSDMYNLASGSDLIKKAS